MRRSSPISLMAWASGLLALASAGAAPTDRPPTLTIKSDGRALNETPVFVDGVTTFLTGNYSFVTPGGKATARGTVYQDRSGVHLVAIVEDVPASGDLHFYIAKAPLPDATAKGVEMIPRGRRIEVRVDGKVVTEYIPDDGPKPYYYPLVGPSGAMMTRSFPMKRVAGEKEDHPHHRSLWFTHGSVNKVDFWSEAPRHGRIVETARPTVVGGDAMGLIRTTDDWIGPDDRKVCEDERELRVYATKKIRILDFAITLKASEGPVTFGDTKEGMFGLRVASSMDVTAKTGGRIVTSEGVEDKAAWGKAAAWVDYSGPVDGKTVGVAILNHPSSFRSPTTWHVRDYGLFAANPFGWHDFGQKTSGEFVLPQGESIRFAYRVVLHDGDAASADLPAAFRAYVEPPKAVLD